MKEVSKKDLNKEKILEEILEEKLHSKLESNWNNVLSPEFEKSYFAELSNFVNAEYNSALVYPVRENIWTAFNMTPPENVRVVILGQDPYIREDQAHGLAFSVPRGAKIPPSLRNVFKELSKDISKFEMPAHGNLEHWANQGVFLLNTILTARCGESKSHARRGWELFTDAVIRTLNDRTTPTVFMLWGGSSIAKSDLITNPAHLVLTAAHPSPLARGAFFGCKHFSIANAFLRQNGLDEIAW